MLLRSTIPSSRLRCGLRFWMWNASLIFRSLFQRARSIAFMPCQSISCGIDCSWTCSAMADLELCPSLIASQCSFFRTRSAGQVSATYSPEHVLHFTDRWKSVLRSIKGTKRVWCEKCAPNASCAGNAAHFLTKTLNKRNAKSYRARFVRCLFLSFKRTACRVSLNLTAHDFVDELSWVTIAPFECALHLFLPGYCLL